MDRTVMTSPSAGSSTTTARLTTVPVPRMPTCGWLMIGVSNSAPRLPVLVSVNVPPASSSGLTWPARVRAGQVGDLAGQAADVEVARVADDRHHQAALGVHGDAEVLGVVVDDLAGLGVETALSLGCTLSASSVASAKNGRKDSLTPSRASNVGLGPLPQPGDRGDVRLHHGGELGRGLQRLDHPLGDDLARPGTAARWCRAAWTARWPRPGRPARRRAPRRGGGRRGAGGGGRGPAAAAAAAAVAPRAARAASSTSCLRIRPPTPVPATGQVHPVLGGELADQRGDVRAVAVTAAVPAGGFGAARRGAAGRRGAGRGGRCGRGRRRGAAELAGGRRPLRRPAARACLRRGRGRLRLAARSLAGGRRSRAAGCRGPGARRAWRPYGALVLGRGRGR